MPRLPRKRSGNSPSDVEWNCLVDFLHSLMPAACADMRTEHGPFGVTRKPNVSPFAGGRVEPVKLCILASVEADYLICNEGTTVGVTINVAKAFELRESRVLESLFSVTSPTVTAWTSTLTYSDSDFSENRKQSADDTSGLGTAETRYAEPIWEPGISHIYAAQCDHTGVTVDSEELTWVDLNNAGRVWAKEFAPPA